MNHPIYTTSISMAVVITTTTVVVGVVIKYSDKFLLLSLSSRIQYDTVYRLTLVRIQFFFFIIL